MEGKYIVAYSKDIDDKWEVEEFTKTKAYELARSLTSKNYKYVCVGKIEAQIRKGTLRDASGFEIKGAE